MFRAVAILLLFCILSSASSQDSLSYADQLKTIELEMDSLSIFNLIDSLFSIDISPKSELNIRFGYSSSVTSAGRDYNLNQAGLSPGISYYHKSGLYGDLSGYWNSGVTPKYNPTILSAGYLGLTSSKWSYSFDYEKWFYNPKDTSDNPLTNSIGASLNYDFKKAYLGLDYSFLFGEETAHRIITNLSWNIKLGKFWIFKNVSLYPSANIMFGNSDVTELRVSYNTLNSRVKERLNMLNTFANLNDQQKKYLNLLLLSASNQDVITNVELIQLRQKIRNESVLVDSDKQIMLKVIDSFNQTSEFVESNKFGLLNYSFTLPLLLSTDRLSILLSYTYSIPVSLPGDFFTVEPIGYFGASISYRIPFK